MNLLIRQFSPPFFFLCLASRVLLYISFSNIINRPQWSGVRLRDQTSQRYVSTDDVTFHIVIFRVVRPCRVRSLFGPFGLTCCFHLQVSSGWSSNWDQKICRLYRKAVKTLFSTNYGKIYYLSHFHISYWLQSLQCAYIAYTFPLLNHFNRHLNKLTL